MRQVTRDPSSVLKVTSKAGLIGAVITFIISQFFPGMDAITQGTVTTMGITLGGAVGKQIRNHVHSYEVGGDREGLGKNGLFVSFLRVLGDIFI